MVGLPVSTEDLNDIRVVPRPLCFLCGTDGEQIYSGLNDWSFGIPGSWDLSRCPACEVVWLDPQPIEEDVPKLYSRYYTHNENATTRFDGLREAILRCVLPRKGYPVHTTERLLPRVLSHVPSLAQAAALDVMDVSACSVGTLLDVGCGNGAFLQRMQGLGWNVTGVEPDPAAVAYAQERGLRVFAGQISDVPTDTRFDVITANHVIEHVINPVGFLKKCAEYLNPHGGQFIITTPNLRGVGHRWFKSYWRGLEVPRHLVMFSPRALSQCVVQAGLRLSTIRTETRLARMIYNLSSCAKAGEMRVAEKSNFRVTTKLAAYLFQALEDSWITYQEDVGEEIYCVCNAP
jgi:2-polyprenyl-3-methyl-5-hydroxy-6-metoxy-1,4-benzoquinol methylase